MTENRRKQTRTNGCTEEEEAAEAEEKEQRKQGDGNESEVKRNSRRELDK